jgi:hypothetical protein
MKINVHSVKDIVYHMKIGPIVILQMQDLTVATLFLQLPLREFSSAIVIH